jgi:hypothetical protein
MSRKSGTRFSDQDLRKLKTLEAHADRPDRDALQCSVMAVKQVLVAIPPQSQA